MTAAPVNYTSTWIILTAGLHNLRTFTNLAGDEVPANDTVSGNVTVVLTRCTAGPDAGYYSYADNYTGGPAYDWKDISTFGTPITFANGSGDDRYSALLPFGFNFQFYGMNWPSIGVGEDGVAQFDGLSSGYSGNAAIPTSAAPNNMLAFLWDDLKQGTSGQAFFYTNNVDTAIVSFINWVILRFSRCQHQV